MTNRLAGLIGFALCFVVGPLLPISTAQGQSYQISGMSDFNFGSWSGGAGDLVIANGNLCIVKIGAGNKKYDVTATGTGSGGAFTVASGANTLAYSVAWKQSGGTGGSFTNLSAGVSDTFNFADNTVGCGGSPNASMRITFLNTSLAAANPGAYNGTITILISP